MKKLICILLSVLMLLSSVVFAQATELSRAEQLALIEYQNYIDELGTEYEFNGVVYATQNGKVLCQGGYGIANTDEDKEITVDTLFSIGSVSKQFCASAVLLLQEQGKLSVNDTLEKYFPEYTVAKDVTLKNLLTMRSGIRDYVNRDFSYIDQPFPTDHYELSADFTVEETRASILNWLYTQRLKFTPDSSKSYSNTNYFLLAIIVEKASGMSYKDFLKENIFNPLGMTNTGSYEDLAYSPDIAEHCSPYGEPIEAHVKGMVYGTGDIVSNVKDIDKWCTGLTNGTLLSEESYKAMTTSYDGYGYGIEIHDNGKLYHNGAICTYVTELIMYPEKGLNIVAITNDYDTCLFNGLPVDDFAYELEELTVTGIISGDIDKDNSVNIKDATEIQSYVAKLASFADNQKLRADVDEDSSVSIKDATAVQMFVAKLNTDSTAGNKII